MKLCRALSRSGLNFMRFQDIRMTWEIWTPSTRLYSEEAWNLLLLRRPCVFEGITSMRLQVSWICEFAVSMFSCTSFVRTPRDASLRRWIHGERIIQTSSRTHWILFIPWPSWCRETTSIARGHYHSSFIGTCRKALYVIRQQLHCPVYFLKLGLPGYKWKSFSSSQFTTQGCSHEFNKAPLGWEDLAPLMEFDISSVQPFPPV